jgi:hypothetical protein
MKKSNGNHGKPTSCCGLGLIQGIVLFMCVGQTLLLGYLVSNHNLFKESLSDLAFSSRNLVRGDVNYGSNVPKKIMEERDDDEEHKDGDETEDQESEVDEKESYNTFPVEIKSINKDDTIPPSSLALIKSMIGQIVEVNFPDLLYRTKDAIRHQYKRLFSELPAYGYLKEYKNPCWHEAGEEGKLACLPYAYILGQPKCGTSDLFERLKGHQDIM